MHASNGAPFLSIEAMQVLVAAGVQHLVVDLPSVDRLHDGGRMAAHHAYWEMERGESPSASVPSASAPSPSTPSESARTRTITELCYIPDIVPDGPYLLDLQVPPFRSDAAPSRPVLYPITR